MAKTTDTKLPVIREVIVVEGRDDTNSINRAVTGKTVETHGFGITAETWQVLEQANRRCGLIIFTDPDFAGEQIRKKLTENFPEAKQAFLTKEDATSGGDIGIENASPEAIRRALEQARAIGSDVAAVLTSQAQVANGGSAASDAAPGAQKSPSDAAPSEAPFTMDDLRAAGLAVGAGSKERRQQVARILGIGYGNSTAFLKKLNGFGILRTELEEALQEIEQENEKKIEQEID